MTPGKMGRYRGRPESNPGKMQYRYKGAFSTEAKARAAQKRLKEQGLKTRVVHYRENSHYPWALYVMAKHDFWKKNFLMG